MHLRGLVTSTNAPGTVIFSLPAAYRPCSTGSAYELLFPSQSGTGAGRIDVQNESVIASLYTPGSHLTLNGVSFSTNNCDQ